MPDSGSDQAINPPQHPWDKIVSETPLGQQAYCHDTKLGTLTPQALTPSPDRDTDEKLASYYQLGAQIEQAWHHVLLSYLLAVDPRVQDKSFQGIIDETYDAWARRVIQLRCTKQPTPMKLKDLSEAQLAVEVKAGNHNHHLEKLACILRQPLAENDEVYQAGDVWRKRRMEGYELLKVLRSWTEEWEKERDDLEALHGYKCNRRPGPVAPKDAPFPNVEPSRTRK